MDAARFDAWTRRRVGLLVGGLATALVDFPLGRGVLAKKKRKRRCKKLGFPDCKTSGKRRRCCKGLGCDRPGMSPIRRCCLPPRSPCDDTADPPQCCGGRVCQTIQGLDGRRCCVFGGDPCTATAECCFERFCIDGTCQEGP